MLPVEKTEEQVWIDKTIHTISVIEEHNLVPEIVDQQKVTFEADEKALEPSLVQLLGKFHGQVWQQVLGGFQSQIQAPEKEKEKVVENSELVGQVVDAALVGSKLRIDKTHPNLSEVVVYRYLYTTEDKGQIYYATSMLILPKERWKDTKKDSKASPPNKTLVWCHGTTGIQWPCAPSIQDMSKFLGSIPGLTDFLKAGCSVVAPDYIGLGLDPNAKVKTSSEFHQNFAKLISKPIQIAPLHPYLVGVPLGTSICHAALAVCADATNNPWELSKEVVFYGHSEGGFGAIWASKLWNKLQAQSSAFTKTNLVGAAISSPATSLSQMIDEKFQSTAGKVIGSYGLVAWAQYYQSQGVRVEDVCRKDYLPLIKKISSSCIKSFLQMAELGIAAYLIPRNWYVCKPTELPLWTQILQENTPTPEGITCPVLLIQGGKDDIVPPQITENWGIKLLLTNTRVKFATYKNDSHFSVTHTCLPELLDWMKSL